MIISIKFTSGKDNQFRIILWLTEFMATTFSTSERLITNASTAMTKEPGAGTVINDNVTSDGYLQGTEINKQPKIS